MMGQRLEKRQPLPRSAAVWQGVLAPMHSGIPARGRAPRRAGRKSGAASAGSSLWEAGAEEEEEVRAVWKSDLNKRGENSWAKKSSTSGEGRSHQQLRLARMS